MKREDLNRAEFDPNKGTYDVQIFNAFFERPKTMMQVSYETGIERAYICRILNPWRLSNTVSVTKLAPCPITRADGVQFLTTDPDQFPKNPFIQLTLSL